MSWDTELDEGSPAYTLASDPAKCIRVIAGPGTGKSFGLQRRAAKLLEDGVPPQEIFAVTFTRLAASDMKKDILKTGINGADKVFVKTLHSYCYSVLSQKEVFEQTKRFPRPMLDFEMIPMLYDLNREEFGSLKEKKKRFNTYDFKLSQNQKNECDSYSNKEENVFESDIDLWLKEHRSMLFNEIIHETYYYLTNNPQCYERHRFKHVLVDEYQDLNEKEQALINLLASQNLVIIGDDDQSIYSFKHASPAGIRNFSTAHPDCKDITFDQCRRCPKTVVSMASSLISHNSDRMLGALDSFSENQDGEVQIIQWKSLRDEVEGLVEIIQKEIKTGKIRPEDILILSLNNEIGTLLQDSLIANNIEAKSYLRNHSVLDDNFKYYFSLLNWISNKDDFVSLRYLIGCKSPNFYNKSYSRIQTYARNHQLSIRDVLDSLLGKKLSLPHTKNLVEAYRNLISETLKIKETINLDRNQIYNCLPIGEILSESIIEIGYMETSSLEEWISKIRNLILGKLSFQGNILHDKHVKIMSLHASKGLSAKFVIIAGCSDPFLSEKVLNLKEARRLLYVAITRCKYTPDYPGKLVISSFEDLCTCDFQQFKFSTKYRSCEFFLTKHVYEMGADAPLTCRKKTMKRPEIDSAFMPDQREIEGYDD